MSWQDEAVSLRKEGLSIRETARKLGVPYSTLWDFLQRCQQDGESSKEYFPKISIFDVESAPFLSYAWRRWKQNLSQEMVVKEGYLLTAAYKELGSELVHSCNITEVENDYPVVETIFFLSSGLYRLKQKKYLQLEGTIVGIPDGRCVQLHTPTPLLLPIIITL